MPKKAHILRATLEYVQHFANVATGELALPSCFMRGFKKPRQCPTVRQKIVQYGLHYANVTTRWCFSTGALEVDKKMHLLEGAMVR